MVSGSTLSEKLVIAKGSSDSSARLLGRFASVTGLLFLKYNNTLT